MHIFYTPDINRDVSLYTLSEEESKHCIRVLRLATGHQIRLMDGSGGIFDCEISDAHPKRTQVRVLSFVQEASNREYRLHLAVAPTKNIERFEWFLEKATEVGVDEITPIICEHSERKDIKLDRLNKIIIAAMKQSQQSFLPKLNQAIRLSDFFKKDLQAKRFIAHCVDDQKQFLKTCLQTNDDSLILIGPEGDFSHSEIAEALASEFTPISLGSTRLRTETAAVVACVEVSLINR